MQKEGKQYYHSKGDTYKWNIIDITVGVHNPELFFIKCDDTGAPLSPNTGFNMKASSVRLDGTRIIIDSDHCWVELTLDNINEYSGAPVTDLSVLFGQLTNCTF